VDSTIARNIKLFDDTLQILNLHAEEDGVREALADLEAAKLNYEQRSIDHMVGCLFLALHDLVVHPPSQALQNDLKNLVDRLYADILRAGSSPGNMARNYERTGAKPLSNQEILEEVNERRGASR
jgi:hypothetical protein